eukprot:CAMPEP_0204573318 /NCGR_PEP_ID=MMETSP0661-20131031/39950_1 /ASSEMBLY_ACC=CAM_ASM_000606 /TAXON_ID=109239 /ORGANISM="Alexandrium margalefi, Strain AMGDE01CS-322" /LENGTH=43 /DNA_ID= /DNA_START= /DNA_END= /DNA_ORIENTATION=
MLNPLGGTRRNAPLRSEGVASHAPKCPANRREEQGGGNDGRRR